MSQRRTIDERDIDTLLKSLTDRQIADLYEMSVTEVAAIRRQRRATGSDGAKNPGQIDGAGNTD